MAFSEILSYPDVLVMQPRQDGNVDDGTSPPERSITRRTEQARFENVWR